jgi:hypothetical protein
VDPHHCDSFGRTRGVFSKVVLGSETLDRTSKELGEMLEGDSADTFAGG